jgi:uncharacterized phage-associated protein
MSAKYTPQQIANYFIYMHKQEGKRLDFMKLLKLVYIAYAWYLNRKNEKLFEESIQAWKDGPVIPSLYHEFKTQPSFNIQQYSLNDEGIATTVEPTDDEVHNILGAVFIMYGKSNGKELSRITHENAPWKNAINKGYNAILDDEDIKKSAEIGINKYFAKYEDAGK